MAKLGRPREYQSADERPATVSLRIPRDLYEQARRHVRMRHPMTITDLLLDGLRLRLETPADPRDLILSDDNTVIRELQEMVNSAVQVALLEARRRGTLGTGEPPAHAADISYLDNTVLQENVSETRSKSRGEMRQRILTLLAEHGEGLRAEEIRMHLKPEKSIGDTLQGMQTSGVVRTQGKGRDMRYFVA